MSRIIYRLVIPALAILVTACGESGSNENNESSSVETNDEIENKFCGSLVNYQDLTIVTPDFDLNKDGCLDQSELDSAIAYSSDIKSRTREGDIIKNEDVNSSVKSADLIGNAEVINGRAQIYTNIKDGKFHITFSTSRFENEGDYIFIGFSNGTSTQLLNGDEGIKISEGLSFDEEAFFDTTIECKYSDNFKFKCSGVTGIIDNNDIFELLPVDGYLVLLVCNTGGCYDNHATIPVTLN